MFSNGIISFQNPDQSGLAWSNLGVQNFSTNMGSQFNYSIFPMWTDLINIVGSFTTEGNKEFQRYNWIGISPFYDSARLNTFSVEIRPDGQIIANYSLINIDYGIVGTVGDSSKGEFTQLHSSPGTIANWSLYTYGSEPTTPEEPQPETSPPVVIITPAVEIVATNTGVETTPIPQAQINPITQSAENLQSSTSQESMQSSGSGINISRLLSIVSREQARIGALERSTVESSIEQSVVQASQATQEAESISENSQSDNLSISIGVQQEQAGGTGLNFLPSTSQLFSVSPLISNPSLDYNSRSSDTQTEAAQIEETKNESVSISGFSAVDLLKQETDVSIDQTTNEQKPQTVRRDVPNNELAGGVTLASLGTQPRGFEAYSLTIPDGQFYAPREIYRNQNVIDNPSSRRLFGGSDNLHQQMINQQYIGK
jgi:hypothetical protein